MNRLQTKCVAASAAAHGLLLALLVVGSAFVKAPPKPENVRFVRLFDASKITDDETQGGGNPNVPSDVAPAPMQPAVIPQPVVPRVIEPPVKQPEPKPKAKQPEPVVEQKKPEPKPQVKKPEPKVDTQPKMVKNPSATKVLPKSKLTEKAPEPVKPKVEVNLEVRKATADPDAQRKTLERERAIKEAREREEAERQAAIRAQLAAVEQANREHRQRVAAVSGIVGKVDTGLARTTNVEMPGPGGEAFINYADLIWTKYYQAWVAPETRDVRNPTRVEIVVTRDGRVISSNIIKGSGDATLDRSVRQALDRVTRLPAFPVGAKDAQRTFRINFELKSKRQFG